MISASKPSDVSPASLVACWPPEKRRAWWSSLTEAEQVALAWHWPFYARPSQLPPDWPWLVFLFMAGRGAGKSRACCEWINGMARRSGVGTRLFLAGRTAADVRDVIVEGESGIIAIAAPDNRPVYYPSKRRVVWPGGAQAILFSAEEPDQPRGTQTHYGYGDELASWGQHAWDFWSNLLFGMRLGQHPQCVASTTPRPTRLMRYLLANASVNGGEDGKWCHVTTGSTYDNMANLPESFRQQILSQYEGTRLGRAEIWGEMLTDTPGALWTPAQFELDGFRIGAHSVPDLPRCVVGVDPAASSGEGAANTGIITAGRGTDDHYYILADHSLRGTPAVWGRAAVDAYKDAFEGDAADYIVAEANQGGEMVRHVISTTDGNVPVRLVHASRGKQIRAEPISALYEQRRVHHVGHFDALEDEMTTWVPGKPSPDRVDAAVWACSELMAHKSRPMVDAAMVIDASPRKGGYY